MKYLSIFLLAIFVNFTALPSLAVVFGIDIPSLSINDISEEEEAKNDLTNYNEKIPPKPYHFKDFFGAFLYTLNSNSFIITDDSIHLSPYISIFSPPPEV